MMIGAILEFGVQICGPYMRDPNILRNILGAPDSWKLSD